ncbi:EAL domain-containing protein [Micromonospora arida]|uniref:EAL domain-containing protein n=1 Tax=Micromonospora arida TaxID=2203715 RepID=UPI003CFBB8B6
MNLLRKYDASPRLLRGAGAVTGDDRDQPGAMQSESDSEAAGRLKMLDDLRQMLRAPSASASGDTGKLVMHYQPQIVIETGEVAGLEARLLWQHPQHGIRRPEELVGDVKGSAIARLLTERAISALLLQLAEWSVSGVGLRTAIDVEMRDLQGDGFRELIGAGLKMFAVSAERLQLEVSEDAPVEDPLGAMMTVSALHSLGVAISLDNFGAGKSSLHRLRSLPLTEVKLDRSFIMGMSADADDAAIVRSVIELAHALDLRVVANGVEDERTMRLLHADGCDLAQGRFYAQPMTADALRGWLSQYQPVQPSGPAPERAASTGRLPSASRPGS